MISCFFVRADQIDIFANKVIFTYAFCQYGIHLILLSAKLPYWISWSNDIRHSQADAASSTNKTDNQIYLPIKISTSSLLCYEPSQQGKISVFIHLICTLSLSTTINWHQTNSSNHYVLSYWQEMINFTLKCTHTCIWKIQLVISITIKPVILGDFVIQFCFHIMSSVYLIDREKAPKNKCHQGNISN